MDFNCKQNFKEKNLTIQLTNLTGLYDEEGNLIHETTSEFEIKNYIKYNKSEKDLMNTLAFLCKLCLNHVVAMSFFAAVILGILANFMAKLIKKPSITPQIILMCELVSYIAFQHFYNIEMPPACHDFFKTFFSYTIKLYGVFAIPVSAAFKETISFSFAYDLQVTLLNNETIDSTQVQ